MKPELERILSRVQKPARYTGGEYGSVRKDTQVDCRVALCFPDTYEIGMSNLGLRILYGVLNAMEGVWCQRVFAPWTDMEREMREAGLPLYALESGDGISQFDIIGFSLGYELAYTNVLNMLDLAGLPIRSENRLDLSPLIVAGGACVFNPEPLADFVDIFLPGEGEDALPFLVERYRAAKRDGLSKEEFLLSMSREEGYYVPSLYEHCYREDGTLSEIRSLSGAPALVAKRIVQDMDAALYPENTIVPSTEIVHDRVMLELFRGCIRGCRFCQAGYVYRPVRSRSPDLLTGQGIRALAASGYQEISLASLSTSDYRPLGALCDGLLEWCEPRNAGLSLPSLRADNFSVDLMRRVQRVRKSGLTFAPEAGTQRLRDAINKNLTEEDLLRTCRTAFSGGWNQVKLYFMLGLPTETDEDVLGIADLAFKVLKAFHECAANRSRGVKITVSTALFVPKPHTPFQWEAQDDREAFQRKIVLLRSAMRSKSISYNWHDPDTSLLEAVLARGDRKVGNVLETAWRNGARFDAWEEHFSLERWKSAFAAWGLDPAFYANRPRSREELLPWSTISSGVRGDYLWRERERAYRSEITPDCRRQCTGCGADSLYTGGKCDD